MCEKNEGGEILSPKWNSIDSTSENTKRMLLELMDWRIFKEDARIKFLTHYGMLGRETEEIEVSRFEERFQEFKMNNPKFSNDMLD